jgi:choice-of-anchor B domain-containing protein
MLKKTLLLLMFVATLSNAQSSIELLGSLNQYPSIGYNDIWGYVDGQGIEYALLGTRHGTSIVRLDNPSTPVEVAFIPGPQSIWRDIKVHGTYAYAVTEATGSGQGLQIIDLSNLPNSAALVNTVDTWFSRAHNMYIDNGYAYVIGTNGGGGMHILDLSDPVNPTRTAYYTGSNYIHDVYVWNDTVVTCAESKYDLVDVSDKSNPQLISSSIALPGIYAHSGWMSEDKRYFFGTEEFNSIDITVWDLQDRTTWDLVVPSWETNSGATVHNLFILGNYAHISYYSDGYVVLDISNPETPQLAAEYSTPDMWGCYPYLPSGITICSDIINGLYVFQFDNGIPVELTSFSAHADKQNIILNWSTATETNNMGFEIQRKVNDDYLTIGFVDGSGTTTERKDYSFIDNDLDKGVYNYRLKQVDFNGRSTYSDEIKVEFFTTAGFEITQNYPNPFNPTTQIKFTVPNKEFINLSVFNLLGEKVSELVNQSLDAGQHEVTFDASDFSSGIYFAKLRAGTFTQIIKMSLLK